MKALWHEWKFLTCRKATPAAPKNQYDLNDGKEFSSNNLNSYNANPNPHNLIFNSPG